jgi:hypothetical protein
MKHSFLAILVLLCVGSEAVGQIRDPFDPNAIELEMRNEADHHQKMVAAVREVDLKAGVTQSQANVIARLYFQAFISGCGYADNAVDRGSRWEVTPRMGYGGTPDQNPIVIEKHTGMISWGHGKAFASLAALLAKLP